MALGCPFNITTSVTGDCQNNSSGGFSLNISGTGPYLLRWIVPNGNPNTSVEYEEIKLSSYQINGLPVGTYSFSVTDSCINPSSQSQVVNITITSATCVTIDSQDTICGLDNGYITATTETFYGQGYFDLYKNDTYYTGFTGASNPVIFEGLGDGIYYVVANDGGGCTGKSENCVVMSSTTLQYGLYVVNDANCTGSLTRGSGKVYVTGLTGNGPFTYSWSDANKSTTSYITGLTAGFYNVTITDSFGCISTQVAEVLPVPLMGLISTINTPPTCYGNDGEITITISGGSAPYYYLNNNTGEVQISFNQTITYSNLAANQYTFTITDAGLCKLNLNVTLVVPTIFNVLSVNTKNATCQNSNGSISIILNGGTPPYNYKLITSQSFELLNITSLSTNYLFSNLSADTYTLIINDSTNLCNYQQFITINGNASFTVTASAAQPICGNNNGSITITKSPGGTGPFVYSLNNILFSPQEVSSAYTFYNLTSGYYNVRVIDITGCSQTTGVNLVNSNSLQFFLSKTDVITNNDGTINAYITSGNPPFTTNWSNNVNGQTGLTLNSLSAGTYSVTIIDNSGCTNSSEITLLGRNTVGDYQVFNICSGTLTDQRIPQKQGIQQMVAEGFFDLSAGNTSCILYGAKMTAIVNIGGTEVSSEFYNCTSISDIPSDSLWVSTITDLIKSVYGIGDVTVDINQNTIIITTNCNLSQNVLNDAEVNVDLKIDYDIRCISCEPAFQVFTACCDGSYWLVASRLGNFSVGDTIYTTGGCMSFVVVDPSTVEISGIVDNELFESGQYFNCPDCINDNIPCTPSPTPTPTITPTATPNNTPTPTPTPTKTQATNSSQFRLPIGNRSCNSSEISFTQTSILVFYVALTTNIYNTSASFQIYTDPYLTTTYSPATTTYILIGNNLWSINQFGVASFNGVIGSYCIF